MKNRSTMQTQNLRQQSLWQTFMLALLLMLMVGTSEAAVTATLDRTTVYAGDTVTLTIESDSLQSNQQPDLAPLDKNFDVLSTSTSTQVSIFNGQRSDKTLWQVQLQPRHTGQLRIPPLNVGGQTTAPIKLKVTDVPQQSNAETGKHVFVKARIEQTGKQTYVQQQIPYTVRLYYDDRLLEGDLIAPKPDNAVVEQLGEDKNYKTVRDGRSYNVIERRYVISPEKSGSLQIPAATFRRRITVAQARQRNSQSGSLMGDFFGNSLLNDDFFNNSPFGNPGKAIVVRSRSINMNIKAQPVTAARNWLPAETVTLTDSWAKNPPKFTAGEPVSRTITIQARGLSGSQIPELAIATPANARLYPEAAQQESRTDGKTVYGVRTQTLTYIADAQGKLDIPAITLNWWNTRHDKTASTTLPAMQFKVLPGTTAAASAANNKPATAVRPAKQDVVAAVPTSESAQKEIVHWLSKTLPNAVKENRLWAISGSGILLTLLVVMMILRTKQRRLSNAADTAKQTPQPERQARPSQKSILRTLEKACQDNDRHAAANALLSLGQAHWPDEPPRSLNALAARIENGQAQLRELDHSLYAADASLWNGSPLWDKFRHGLQLKKTAEHGSDDGISPLYPQHS